MKWTRGAFAAVAVTLLSVVALAVVIGYSAMKKQPQYEYAVVVDAGSSHSEFLIYTWRPTRANVSTEVYEVPRVNQVKFSCSTDKGISMYDTPQDSANSLADCLRKAAAALPENARPTTPIYLRSTAGMRVMHNNDPAKAQAILDACEQLFRNSTLDGARSSAIILPGSLEGGFGWITTNYVADQILPTHKSKQHDTTAGALDLGGASTQITFDDPSTYSKLSPEDQLHLHLFGNDYYLYTHSYLCYGMNAARQRMHATALQQATSKGPHVTVDYPCLPTGFATNLTQDDIAFLRSDYCSNTIHFDDTILTATLQGTSDTTACQQQTALLLDDGLPPRMGTGQPAVPDQRFFAFSGYYYVIDFLCSTKGLPGCTAGENSGWHMPPSAIVAAADSVCAETAQQLRRESPTIPDKFLMDYCFQGHYVNTILTHGYEFGQDSKQIEFVSEVNGRDVGWTLGFLLHDATEEQGPGATRLIPKAGIVAGVTVTVALACIGLAVLYRMFRRSRSDYSALN
ncbi:ecto-nucleosidase triphosphate diphosphohydrolase 5 [Salpingoeca rosetta]|uniref:Ecto-nucleosidase triphosphate diphosphohydrolase 5 n=1 Tax=Salpingoeca rosetta (strain ATCC 50818 / BSB-021) TaxID=946362 RepID=F2TVA2_SALR5|nr:ecto-nucleosidase triphosphate diphosphohydrolase 5 [Salpingoeca rosetta]EGD71998.1 ecto-nucleosidase triphosphate diphosphohydrolase 5 [Salpingoeca rosetta]|eukprot:XP_004998570.1 ecto-nucleosidase triphosphate diphosphohydrolase 5 [Salpingoeca rosetta]